MSMTIKEKEEELKKLNEVIKLHEKAVMSRQKLAKITELQDRLEYRLMKLKEETIDKELDLKLGVYSEVVSLLTKNGTSN